MTPAATPVAVPTSVPTSVPAPSRHRLSALALWPGRHESADALMLLAMTVIGIVGFRNAYGGHDYLVVGAAGAVLGVALGHVGHRAHLPLLTIAAISVLLFLLLGGVVAQAGIGAEIPTLATMHDVVSASIHGWKQLLTTARPVGTTAHLLVLPYLLGLASGVAGHALARRTSRFMLPAVAPAAVVALSILFGADHAVAAVLQGAAFAGLALAWASLRQQRGTEQRTTIGRQRPWHQLGAGLAVLVIAVTGATFIGPRLPGAEAHQRVVLHAVPPFDFSAYPSPLAGFRSYTKDASPSVSVYAKRLLTTTGLPSGSRVRIATMDTYNGLVWGVANAAAGTSSFAGFQRIGTTSPGASGGPALTATITIGSAYQLPWLPDLPGTTGFDFAGPSGAAVADALRFNVATATGVVPGGLPAGLSYTVTATDAATPTAAQMSHATPYGTPTSSSAVPPVIQAFADAHSAAASSPVTKVLALAEYLKDNGRYSDGGAGQADILAGHSAGRLTEFLQSSQIVGDDEQYAAAMALLAAAVGVPARVALDGIVEPDGSVYGRDVRADVELDLAQYGWVTLPASQFVGNGQPRPQLQITQHPAPAKVVPPPVDNAAPLTTTDNNQSNAVSRPAPSRHRHGSFQIPAFVVALAQDVGLPLLILAAIAAALIAAKSLRRRRRRYHGPAATRITGAWREVLDVGRDLAIVPNAHATRREHAAITEQAGLTGVAAVAEAVDAAVFGPGHPDDAAAAHVWTLAADARRDATANRTRWRRAWVAVNPSSLWASHGAAGRPTSTSHRTGAAVGGSGRPAPTAIGAGR
jgi:hypothetical protein